MSFKEADAEFNNQKDVLAKLRDKSVEIGDTRIQDFALGRNGVTKEEAIKATEDMFERAVQSIFGSVKDNPRKLNSPSKADRINSEARTKDEVVVSKINSVSKGRPRIALPIEEIKDLSKKGYSCQRIADKLSQKGIKASKDTIQRALSQK